MEAKRAGSMLHAAMDGNRYISVGEARRRRSKKTKREMVAENFRKQITWLWEKGEVSELTMWSWTGRRTKPIRGVADRVRIVKDHKTGQKYIQVCDIKTTSVRGAPTEQNLAAGLMQACIYGHMLKGQVERHREEIDACRFLSDAIESGQLLVSAKVVYYNQPQNLIGLWQAGKRESFRGLRGVLKQETVLDHEKILSSVAWNTWLKLSPSLTVSSMCQERFPSCFRTA